MSVCISQELFRGGLFLKCFSISVFVNWTGAELFWSCWEKQIDYLPKGPKRSQ